MTNRDNLILTLLLTALACIFLVIGAGLERYTHQCPPTEVVIPIDPLAQMAAKRIDNELDRIKYERTHK